MVASIELDKVTMSADGHRVLDDVSLFVAEAEFVTIIGSSGAGKTSLLRAIAGFDELDAGYVRFDGADVTTLPTSERDIALVSQHNTLFPTHRVRSNLMFPLRRRAMARAEARKRVEAESKAHDIGHIMDRWPESLSGGEQQLTQIARALVRAPKVLLMDEPLAKLDIGVRRRLQTELVELQQGYGVTMVYVSNRPEEILNMPSRLVALDGGRVTQVGTPAEVRARPVTLAFAELTGHLSRLTVTVAADAEGFWIEAEGIRIRAWSGSLADHVGQTLTLAARAEDVRRAAHGPITAVVASSTMVESKSALVLQTPAGVLHTLEADLEQDATIRATLDKWLLFDAAGRLLLSFPV